MPASTIKTDRGAEWPGLIALLLGLLMAVVAIATLPAVAMAAPEPAPVPKRWQLDLRPGPLRVAYIDPSNPSAGGGAEGARNPQAWFYFTYTVVNNTDEDLLFAPSFEMATEDGSLVRAGRSVPRAVTDELLRRLRNPFLLDQIGVIGMLEQGEENAREGLVVWPAGNLLADNVNIFAEGFSGETKRIALPDTGEEVVLRKVLMLRHLAPGELTGRGDEPVERIGERWIMR